MQKTGNFFLAIILLTAVVSCSKSSSSTSDETSGNWIYRSEFKGAQRSEASAFTVGDTAYVGTGYDGEDRAQDFWAFNPDGNGSWSQRALFPGAARNSAVGFTVSGKGFIATGFDGTNKLKDVWRFDPTANAWKQMKDFGGPARYDAVAYAIGDTAYIATGYANNQYGSGSSNAGDCYAYVPGTDTWIEKTFDGSKRTQAVAFVHSNKAYICTGSNNGTQLKDFWTYDPKSGGWSQLRRISNETDSTFDDDYSDIVRSNAAAFVIGDYAYISTGANGSNTLKTWKYDFAHDLWSRKTPFEGTSRTGAVSLTVKGRSYITMGSSGSTYFDDIWEFNPDQEQTSTDNN